MRLRTALNRFRRRTTLRPLCCEVFNADECGCGLCPDLSTRYALPVFLGRLPAGFPSPADDYIEGKLDLNRHLIKHPAATFLCA